MTQAPEISFLDHSRSESELKNQFFAKILGALSEMPGGAAATKLVVSSGTVVPTAAVHTIDTEGGALADDLENIAVTHHPEGRIVVVSCADNARSVTVKHAFGGLGQIFLHDVQDILLTDVRDRLFLQRIGDNWEELFRAGPSFVGEPADADIVKAPGGVLPALDGSALTGLPVPQSVPDWLIRSTMRNTMDRLVRNGQAVFGLDEAVVDEFEDEAGVDPGGNSFVYSPSGNYVNSPGEQEVLSMGNGGSVGGQMSGYMTNDKLFDGNLTSGAADGWRSWGTPAPYYVTRFLGGPTQIDRWEIIGPAAVGQSWDYDGLTTVTIKNNDTNEVVGIVDTSGISTNHQRFEQVLSTPVTVQNLRFDFTMTIDAGIGGINGYQDIVNDASIQSIARSASSVPIEAVILARCLLTDATLNTDLKAYASRDGGMTWTQGTLKEIADEGGVKFVEAIVNLAEQPSGSQIVWKFETANRKKITLESVGMCW